MQFTDEAIILSTRKFGERDLICQFFTRTGGIYGGFIRAGQSRKKIANFQVGNIAIINWKARLDDQLGSVDAEVINAVSGNMMHDMKRLMALISASVLVRRTLADRDPHETLYSDLCEFLSNEDWQPAYVRFELALLRELGFGLDLDSCAVTGATDGLIYISPKTGRAVTRIGAAGYEDKMLNLPCFYTEMKESLDVTEYFLMKNVFSPHGWKMPEERMQLKNLICKNNIVEKRMSA